MTLFAKLLHTAELVEAWLLRRFRFEPRGSIEPMSPTTMRESPATTVETRDKVLLEPYRAGSTADPLRNNAYELVVSSESASHAARVAMERLPYFAYAAPDEDEHGAIGVAPIPLGEVFDTFDHGGADQKALLGLVEER